MGNLTALIRPPTPRLVEALSSHPDRNSINLSKALKQHKKYAEALEQAGARVQSLTPLEDHPDACFLEDTLVIFDDFALACPLKEPSRQGEVESAEKIVSGHRVLKTLPKGATLDGGDLLLTPKILFVGLSRRTNREAAKALKSMVPQRVVTVPVENGLHLKSGVSYLGEDLILLDPTYVESKYFKDFWQIQLEPEDRRAANCIRVNRTLIMTKGFAKVAKRLGAKDLIDQVIQVDISEFEKADGGISCLSLLIPEAPA